MPASTSRRMFHLRFKGFFLQLLLQLWGFSVLTTFGMIVIYPNFIAPLFNKFKVLEDRELRSKIDALVRAAGTFKRPSLMKWISTFQPIRGGCRMMHTRCLPATPTEQPCKIFDASCRPLGLSPVCLLLIWCVRAFESFALP